MEELLEAVGAEVVEDDGCMEGSLGAGFAIDSGVGSGGPGGPGFVGSGGRPRLAADARCDAVLWVVCFGWLLFGHPLTSPAECAGVGR
jgi:hypothetical protein